MASQVVAGLVGAAIGVMVTTAIAMSVQPAGGPSCPACPACPPPAPTPTPQLTSPVIVDAGVAEADLDGSPDLGDLTQCDLDEVGCLLADRPPACCANYASSRRMNASGSGSGSGNGTSLTAEQIRAVVTPLRARIVRCSEESDSHGIVRAAVKVAPDGRVASVVIRAAPDDALAQCVAHILRSARFPRRDLGVSFTYPFVF